MQGTRGRNSRRVTWPHDVAVRKHTVQSHHSGIASDDDRGGEAGRLDAPHDPSAGPPPRHMFEHALGPHRPAQPVQVSPDLLVKARHWQPPMVVGKRPREGTASVMQRAPHGPLGDPEDGRDLRDVQVEVVPEHRHLPLSRRQRGQGTSHIRSARHVGRVAGSALRSQVRHPAPSPSLGQDPSEPVAEEIPGHRCDPRRQGVDVPPPFSELPCPSQCLLYGILGCRDAAADERQGVHQPCVVGPEELADLGFVQPRPPSGHPSDERAPRVR